MNDGVIVIVFTLPLFYVSLKEIGVVGFDTYTWGIKDFHKRWSRSLAKRRLCLGPAGVINCTPLSALSFLDSRNVWLQQRHFQAFQAFHHSVPASPSRLTPHLSAVKALCSGHSGWSSILSCLCIGSHPCLACPTTPTLLLKV